MGDHVSQLELHFTKFTSNGTTTENTETNAIRLYLFSEREAYAPLLASCNIKQEDAVTCTCVTTILIMKKNQQ